MPAIDAGQAASWGRQGLLLDARAGERYRGEIEPVDPRAGHIPGAVSAPTTGNLQRDGRFLAPAELRERFERLGYRAGVPTAVYCGSGVTAAHEIAALEIAGLFRCPLPGVVFGVVPRCLERCCHRAGTVRRGRGFTLRASSEHRTARAGCPERLQFLLGQSMIPRLRLPLWALSRLSVLAWCRSWRRWREPGWDPGWSVARWREAVSPAGVARWSGRCGRWGW